MNENFMVNQEELLGAIDKILIKSSIATRVSDLQPMTHPVGIITGARYNKDTKKLSLTTGEIEAQTDKITTDFTLESLQDLQSIYKESFYDVLAHYLIDELVYEIDSKFINLVKSTAGAKNNLTFDDTYDKDLFSVGQSIAINIVRGLADLPISDNRSQKGWAIVTGNLASILSATTTLDDNGTDDSPSYLGTLSGVDFYIDYTFQADDDNKDNVVFGIKGNGYTRGSTIFSHYDRNWIETTNYEDGAKNLFLINRSISSINPLDKEYTESGSDSGFLGKFEVDVSALQVMQ